MTAIFDENQAFQDVDGKPIVNGLIYIGTTFSDTKNNLIPIFADRELTIPLANPQSINSFGKAVNKIWVASTFSIVVEDENAVQIYSDQDAGGFASSVGTIPLSNVMGINVLTASANPNLTEYVDQQEYSFKAANTNTGPVTMNVDDNGAIPIKNEGADLAAGRLVADTIYKIIFNATSNIFQLASSSGGDVSGPGSAVDNNMAVFDGITGKLIKDFGISASDVVVGPGSSGNENIPIFNGLTGKIIKDSGVPLSGLGGGDVTGPGLSVDGDVVIFDSITGKLIKDSNIPVAKLVMGPNSSGDGNVTVFDGPTGKIIKDSGQGLADFVTSESPVVNENLPSYNGTPGNVLKDSGIPAGEVVTSPDPSIDLNIAVYDGTSGKVIKDSGIPVGSAFRGALVSKIGGQALLENITTKLTWESERYDTDNIHDNITNNSRLTVPAGVTFVRLIASIDWEFSMLGGREIFVFLNGSGFLGTSQVTMFPDFVGDAVLSFSGAPHPVLGGNYFEIFASQSGQPSLDVSSTTTTWFAMEILQ